MSNFNETPAQTVRNLHKDSDVDADRASQHHTLGMGPTQAAPGDHTHGSNISRERFTVQSPALDPNVEGAVVLAHNLGEVPLAFVGHLEDGNWAAHIQYRVHTITDTHATFVFINLGPNLGAYALLRAFAIY